VSRFNPVTFYRELRHRRVFRVAALYAVGAWGVIAACDVLFPQLTAWVADPDAAMGSVFIAAIVLAPVALVLGWLYDITTEGIQRTASFSATAHDPDTSLHGVDRWILGALGTLTVAVLVATTWHIVHMERAELRAGEPAGPAIPENSIAVLPFEVCAGGDVDPLLATGIASEVLRHLAEIPNLKVTAKTLIVIARASAFAFADTDADPQHIAATLRVHYLLSGTVCREGDAINVQAELVDEGGYLVWSHGYTQQLDAAGQVTRTVAALLAEGVGARLGAVLAIPEGEPVDRLAYEQLLIGREFREKGDKDKARAAFEAALDRKPDYAEAVYELAELELPWDRDYASQFEKMVLLAERALAMARRDVERNPSSAHAHYVVGKITFALERYDHNLSWRKSEPEDPEAWKAQLSEAERHLRRSVELNPSDADAWRLLYLTVEEGQRDAEALSVLERGCERDPLNAPLNGLLAVKLAQFGRYEEAHGVLDRLTALPEIPNVTWLQLFRVAWMQGRWDLYAQSLIEMLEQEDYPDRVRHSRNEGWWGLVYSFGLMIHDWGMKQESGLKEQGEAWKTRLSGLPVPDWWEDLWLPPDERSKVQYQQASRMTDEEILDQPMIYYELLIRSLGDHGEYGRAIPLMQTVAQVRPNPAMRELGPESNLIALAILYLEAGRTDDAAVVLENLAQTLEADVSEGLRDAQRLNWLAVTQALQKRVDAAIATLQLSIASGNGLFMDCHGLDLDLWSRVLDPYASLRADPRFHKLWALCESEHARQVERIRVMLAKRDLDKLLGPLMELAEETKKKKQAEQKKSAGS
jgi:TolB-like protein/Flp pilus assembly protein TadD